MAATLGADNHQTIPRNAAHRDVAVVGRWRLSRRRDGPPRYLRQHSGNAPANTAGGVRPLRRCLSAKTVSDGDAQRCQTFPLVGTIDFPTLDRRIRTRIYCRFVWNVPICEYANMFRLECSTLQMNHWNVQFTGNQDFYMNHRVCVGSARCRIGSR